VEEKYFIDDIDIDTPIGVPYDDDDNGAEIRVLDQDDVDPEAYDNYISAEVATLWGPNGVRKSGWTQAQTGCLLEGKSKPEPNP
jgi:hypothetical protein